MRKIARDLEASKIPVNTIGNALAAFENEGLVTCTSLSRPILESTQAISKKFKLDVDTNATEMGTTTPIPGEHWYASGLDVKLIATPTPGNRFLYWREVGRKKRETDNPLKLTMHKSHEILAIFTTIGENKEVAETGKTPFRAPFKSAAFDPRARRCKLTSDGSRMLEFLQYLDSVKILPIRSLVGHLTEDQVIMRKLKGQFPEAEDLLKIAEKAGLIMEREGEPTRDYTMGIATSDMVTSAFRPSIVTTRPTCSYSFG